MANRLKKLSSGLAAALLLTACGQSGGSGGEVAAGAPIRIAYMDILQGPNATEGGDRGLQLAVEEINAAGGINGHKLEVKSYNTDITPQGAATATNLALKDKPTIMIGFGVSAGLKASINAINQAGIPVLHKTLASITSPESLNSKLTFRIGPTTDMYAKAGDSHLFDTYSAKKVLVVHTSDAAPTEGAASIKKDAEAAGVQVIERSVPPTVTDLTEAVLAAKDVDAVWEWGYATTDALFVKQMQQNGVTKPINTFSVHSAARSGLIPQSLLSDKISYVSACGADALQTPEAVKFRAAFAKKYGAGATEPFQPSYYDAVYLLKAAVEKAASTEPAKVATALETIEYTGVCGTFKSDAEHNMLHNVPVVNFPGGQPALTKNYDALESAF
ncbi:branched-chain amino acid ABC transporter substrate-binding protein [Actinoplanes sp. NPDC026619]|uniref:ABC transporter substrate-binding protein n=1 Tax=Actinoplanes sp. NPDC026619 TaxID=3155798 RepID=UPI0033DF6807